MLEQVSQHVSVLAVLHLPEYPIYTLDISTTEVISQDSDTVIELPLLSQEVTEDSGVEARRQLTFIQELSFNHSHWIISLQIKHFKIDILHDEFSYLTFTSKCYPCKVIWRTKAITTKNSLSGYNHMTCLFSNALSPSINYCRTTRGWCTGTTVVSLSSTVTIVSSINLYSGYSCSAFTYQWYIYISSSWSTRIH